VTSSELVSVTCSLARVPEAALHSTGFELRTLPTVGGPVLLPLSGVLTRKVQRSGMCGASFEWSVSFKDVRLRPAFCQRSVLAALLPSLAASASRSTPASVPQPSASCHQSETPHSARATSADHMQRIASTAELSADFSSLSESPHAHSARCACLCSVAGMLDGTLKPVSPQECWRW